MNNWFRNGFLVAVVVFLAAALVVVAGVSLNAKKQLLFPPAGMSFRWYVELLTAGDWLNAVKNSLIIAASSGLISLSIALPLAYFIWRYRVFYARALFTLGVAPFMLPPVITALGFLVFWVTIGMYGSMTIISHTARFV